MLSEALYLPLALAADALLRRLRRRGGTAPTTRASAAGVLLRRAPSSCVRARCLRAARGAVAARRRRGAATRVDLRVLPWRCCVAPVDDAEPQHVRPLVVVASEGGVTFWTGNHPLARGEGDLAANPEIKRAEIAFRRRTRVCPPKSWSRSTTADALRIRAHPAGWLRLLVEKGVLYGRAGRSVVYATLVEYNSQWSCGLRDARAAGGRRTDRHRALRTTAALPVSACDIRRARRA